MRDSNYPMQKAYLLALSGITYNSVSVPVYYQMIPDNLNVENYIIFGPVTNNDLSNITSAETNSLMRVTVHSFKQKYNDGKAANSIAGDILSRIYPNSQTVIDLGPDNLQCVDTSLVSDITLDYNIINSKVYIDRVFVFRHRIFHG